MKLIDKIMDTLGLYDEEDDMLDMMLHGGNRVCIENLQAVLDWYKNC